MQLSDYVNTFGQWMLRRRGERVHKLAIHAGFTCPNRDGTKGRSGCSFCNNATFSPHAGGTPSIGQQIAAGRAVIARRTRAHKFIAYFQAYTNTYADVERLRHDYDEALAQPDVIGLAIGTRPDCVPPQVLELLCDYRDRGVEVWLELGLQSSFDHTLARVDRGHGFAEYRLAVHRAHALGLAVCTHLIIGLPGETGWHARTSLSRVLEEGVEGLKLHPLHVVRGTRLAHQWQRGGYRALEREEYITIAADLVQQTPPEVVFHRLTGTAAPLWLLAPRWCAQKWSVLNGITRELARRGTRQGVCAGRRAVT